MIYLYILHIYDIKSNFQSMYLRIKGTNRVNLHIFTFRLYTVYYRSNAYLGAQLSTPICKIFLIIKISVVFFSDCQYK